MAIRLRPVKTLTGGLERFPGAPYTALSAVKAWHRETTGQGIKVWSLVV